MQMCGVCMKVYDESEYAKCPYCNRDKDEYTHVIVFDKKTGKAKSVPKEEAHLYEQTSIDFELEYIKKFCKSKMMKHA